MKLRKTTQNLLKLSCTLIVFLNVNSYIVLSQNVGISETGAAPADAAALDISSNDKGILIPRVALTNRLIYAPVTGTPVNSLMVYNTNTLGTDENKVVPGYYYWENSQWNKVATDQSSYNLLDVTNVTATTPVNQSAPMNTIVNNINLGLQQTVTIPANTEVLVVINYSVPMGMFDFGNRNGYYGIRLLKNGIEMPEGSRKFSFLKNNETNMISLSATYTELFPASAAVQTIIYDCRGYVENYTLGTANVRFNMWSATGNNYNWGRATMIVNVYEK